MGCSKPIYARSDSKRVYEMHGKKRVAKIVPADKQLITIACGSSKRSVCESCSRTYQKRALKIILNGLPPEGDGIVVFGTVTAPSYGPCHFRPKREGGVCRCKRVHQKGDPLIGVPLNMDRYDYAGAVAWQFNVRGLWSASMKAMRYEIAKTLGVKANKLAKVMVFIKCIEYQERAMVHVHFLCIVRGKDLPIEADELASKLRECLVDNKELKTKGVSSNGYRWGVQSEFIPIYPDGEGESGYLKVAGYIASYLVKDIYGQVEEEHYRGSFDKPINKHRRKMKEKIELFMKSDEFRHLRSNYKEKTNLILDEDTGSYEIYSKKLQDKAMKQSGYLGNVLSKSRAWGRDEAHVGTFKELKKAANIWRNGIENDDEKILFAPDWVSTAKLWERLREEYSP